MHTIASGTPLWMAPEVKRGGLYSFPSDVYSLGLVYVVSFFFWLITCSLYEIFEKKLPEYDTVMQVCKLPKNFMVRTFLRQTPGLTV